MVSYGLDHHAVENPSTKRRLQNTNVIRILQSLFELSFVQTSDGKPLELTLLFDPLPGSQTNLTHDNGRAFIQFHLGRVELPLTNPERTHQASTTQIISES